MSNLFDKSIDECTSKELYMLLLKQVNAPVTSQLYFNAKYDMEDEWPDIYRRIYSSTIETKLRSFQFKMVHNILYTNTRLFKARMVESDLCTFCKVEKETVEHLFHACTCVKGLWEYVMDKFFHQFGIHTLSIEEKLFGKNVDLDSGIFVNHVIILTKWYIHRSRIQDVRLEVEGLKIFMNQTRQLEERIAIKGNKLRTHTLKWQFL